RPLVIAHLNHQLRGAESDADEQFVRDLHFQLSKIVEHDVKLAVQRTDMAQAAVGANLEATARRERYRFLAEVALEHGVTRVTTGHTANDQAETVLHRLLRGTGLQGLRGISPHRELVSGVQLVRPLLQTSRADLIAYLGERRQPFREDSSNADLSFTRNRIRHELLPLLKQYNPGLVDVLCRLAEQARETQGFFTRAACRLLGGVALQ